MFCSGVAGTGKSYLIEALRDSLTQKYGNDANGKRPVVVVSAPTGVASHNVDGITLHQLFKLPVEKDGRSEGMTELVRADQQFYWRQMRNSVLFIIDEISMVSAETWVRIHKRMTQIFGVEDPEMMFAGRNILVFGDLLQLQPVKAAMIYEKFRGPEMSGVDLWLNVDYRELTKNMRQGDDKLFAEMLNRIRIGSPSENDIDQLKRRLMSVQFPELATSYAEMARARDQLEVHYSELSREGRREPKMVFVEKLAPYFDKLLQQQKGAVALFPHNGTVLRFNVAMLLHQKIELRSFEAEDEDSGVSKKRKRKKKEKKRKGPEKSKEKTGLAAPSDPLRFCGMLRDKDNEEKKDLLTDLAQTAGMHQTVRVGVGARVMLTRNFSVPKGLVNGAMGTVSSFQETATGQTSGIWVEFDDPKTGRQLIERVIADYELSPGVFIRRYQFALTLAYAITVHKCQGLSLNCILIDMNFADSFMEGMSYVALSRARRLDQVYIVDFDLDYSQKKPAGVFTCNQRSWHEYNRLRKVFNMRRSADLSPLPSLPECNNLPASVKTKDNYVRSEAISRRIVDSAELYAGVAVSKAVLTLAKTEPKGTSKNEEGKGKKKKQVADRANEDKKKLNKIEIGIYEEKQCNQLRLPNEGNTCYANAILQSFFRLKSVRLYLSTDTENEIEKQMKLIMSGRQRSTVELRSWFPPPFNTTGNQQDAEEFLATLLELTTEDLASFFQFGVRHKWTCSQCNRQTEEEQETKQTVIALATFGTGRLSIDEAIQRNATEMRLRSCLSDTCSGHVTQHQTRYVYRRLNRQQYLVIRLVPYFGASGDGPRQNSNLTGFRKDNFRFMNQSWVLMAAVEHRGATQKKGHYTAWLRDDNWWMVASDTDLSHRKSLLANLAGFSVLVFALKN